MANEGLKPLATLLLTLNFCMYIIVAAIGGWAINVAIDNGFTIDAGLQLPAHFSPVFFPIGNAATGFFAIFAVLAGVVGAAAAIAGVNHVRSWSYDSLPSAASSAVIAWTLTLLAMGERWRLSRSSSQLHNSCIYLQFTQEEKEIQDCLKNNN
ncbi:membrane protein PM19L-like isoform X2 [Typha latifolia]|uniref:membrane protein PM19L-like isoform X2 n=1 Tax=Typha latifolia TaxID=4733 RepID=UPI003C2EAB3F